MAEPLTGRGGVVVWDPLVRIFHWALAVTFFLAFLTDDDAMIVHAWAGYVVGGLILFRVIWGFVGPRHARFADFSYGPGVVLRYLADLVAFRAPRYLGHSPGGGAMVFALLAVLAATVVTGLLVYAAEQDAGPLAGIVAAPAAEPETTAMASDGGRADSEEDEDGDERRSGGGESAHEESPFAGAFEEAHETLADLAFALVIVHVLGVLWASLSHRDNLTWAMVTGRRRPPET